ncbi:MAG: hypothetical protein GX567_16160, partial [Clostridia bacterium]|nr:hypothetical protein [Clostridia bacterium]
SMAFLPYELSETEIKNQKKIIFAVVAALVASWGLCTWALQDKELAKEELNITISNEVYEISDYINKYLPENKVLMDSFLTNGVILNVNNIDNLVVSSSLNFYECVSAPGKYGIEYVLVPDTSGVGNLDALNQRYPNLYKDGAEWCELEADFEGFRIYRVTE